MTGLVPDVRPYLAAAAVFAAPLRFGAGHPEQGPRGAGDGRPDRRQPERRGRARSRPRGSGPPLTVASPSDPAGSRPRSSSGCGRPRPTPRPPTDGRAFVERYFTWERSGDLLDGVLRDAAADGRIVPRCGSPTVVGPPKCGSLRRCDDRAATTAQTALVVVDVQNDFADPAGGLSVAGGAEVDPGRSTARSPAPGPAGALVVYTQDWHPESTPHFAKDGGIWPVHCVAGSWGAELHPTLIVDGPVVRKGDHGEDGYSGLHDARPDDRAPTSRPRSRPCSRPQGIRAGRRRRAGDRLLRQGDGARCRPRWAIRPRVLAGGDPRGRPGGRRRRPGDRRDGAAGVQILEEGRSMIRRTVGHGPRRPGRGGPARPLARRAVGRRRGSPDPRPDPVADRDRRADRRRSGRASPTSSGSPSG